MKFLLLLLFSLLLSTATYTLLVKNQWTELEPKREKFSQLHRDDPKVSAFIFSKDKEHKK